MKVRRLTRRFTVCLITSLLMTACGSSEDTAASDDVRDITAETIYSGGPVITANDDQPIVEAVAVVDGKIIAVGDKDMMETYRGTNTIDVDLAGKTLSPGFVDGHAHFAQFGLQAIGANLLAAPDGEVQNINQLIAKLKEFAEGPDVGRTGWIFGLGYDDSVLAEGRHPTRDDLDKVSTELPVIAVHISGHFSAVNSKALELIGYDASTEDPSGGVIRRRPSTTEPNGVLEELASIPIMMKFLSPKSPDDAVYFMNKGIEMAMSFGYTTAQEGRAFASAHTILANYAEQFGFPIDVVSYIDYTDTTPIESDWYSSTYRNGYRVAGMKITLDGSPQGRTAWRTEPYLLPPDGQGDGYVGYGVISDEEANAAVDLAYVRDWQVIVHANGDAAIDQLLGAVRSAVDAHGGDDRRTTLIHGQYIREDQLDSLIELNMSASLFPMHTYYWGDWHRLIIGDEKGDQISPMRSALNRGLPLTSHTDAPVALPNLMQVMWATVNRVSRGGQVIGDGERLTPEEAFKTITLWGAKQHFEEATKGSIEVGKRADMIMLSDNPLTIDPSKINEIEVVTTIKDGQIVWQKEQ